MASQMRTHDAGETSPAKPNEAREMDWRTKAISHSLIIEPGRTGGGFVYFQLPEGQTLARSTLRLAVESLETGETVELRLAY